LIDFLPVFLMQKYDAESGHNAAGFRKLQKSGFSGF
jgi:hypothetical protein